MNLPLFPLHTVLCPGVALPLHVFEERYKAMVERCLAQQSPFGVVLIREGREVGSGVLAVAAVGTVAEIREATRFRDGRFHLVTLGTQRFRLDGIDPEAEPYLVGRITPLKEILGEAARARLLAERVVQLFIRYLALLQAEGVNDRSERGPAVGDARTHGRRPEAAGEPWALETEPGEPWASDPDDPAGAGAGAEARAVTATGGADAAAGRDDPAGADAAAPGWADAGAARGAGELDRQLTIPDDPTVLSHVLSGIVQIEAIRRQGLLEMATTELRLVELAQLLGREIALLERGLGAYAPDPRLATLRRN